MPDGISKQGKDIIYKILTHEFKDKSFIAIGLDVPKIKEFLIADFPYVIASEIRADNIFLLEDDSILVVDFESDIKKSDYVKYLGYLYAVLNHYLKTENILYNITKVGYAHNPRIQKPEFRSQNKRHKRFVFHGLF